MTYAIQGQGANQTLKSIVFHTKPVVRLCSLNLGLLCTCIADSNVEHSSRFIARKHPNLLLLLH